MLKKCNSKNIFSYCSTHLMKMKPNLPEVEKTSGGGASKMRWEVSGGPQQND